MKEMLNNKTIRVIVLLLALAGLTAIVGSRLDAAPHKLPSAGVGGETINIQTPAALFQTTAAEAPAQTHGAAATPRPANAYVVVTAGSESRIFPLPETGEAQYKIVLRQKDGRESTNVINLTKDSMAMHSSTCDNQLCVEQGEVTLSNRSHRLLGNKIICLPNNVLMEMYTPNELLEAVKEQTDR